MITVLNYDISNDGKEEPRSFTSISNTSVPQQTVQNQPTSLQSILLNIYSDFTFNDIIINKWNILRKIA